MDRLPFMYSSDVHKCSLIQVQSCHLAKTDLHVLKALVQMWNLLFSKVQVVIDQPRTILIFIFISHQTNEPFKMDEWDVHYQLRHRVQHRNSQPVKIQRVVDTKLFQKTSELSGTFKKEILSTAIVTRVQNNLLVQDNRMVVHTANKETSY